MKDKLLAGKWLEYAAFVLFAVLYCVITAFHEPWFDEAQAWQIAKCASLREILFTIPHYEGHPPLWHLLLVIPAKLGVPFEIGLKSIGFLISCASAGLLLFRSRLPRPVRLLLPFSFFFFYQYGVIVRPYGLMLLLLLLLGQEFPLRRERPWRITVLLMLLCLASAYGIVIAGGIALGLVWDLLREKGFQKTMGELFSDPRSGTLLALLLLAILLILELLPRSDTWVTSRDGNNSPLLCLVCAFFTFLGDCLLTDSFWFNRDTFLLQNTYISIPELLSYCLIGAGLLLFLAALSSGKNFKFFLLPYALFTAFSAFVYVSAHHVGIALTILLFWLEADMGDADRFALGRSALRVLAKNERDRKLLLTAARVIVLACLLLPLYWTVSASVREIRLEYSYGRSASAFLRENHLENSLILSSWGDGSSEKYGERIGHEDYRNTDENGTPVLICAYFDRNICMNLGDGSDHDAYMHWRMADYETSLRVMEGWARLGTPDLLIGKPELKTLYGDSLSAQDYSLVFVPEINYIWKNKTTHSRLPIFLRNDLLGTYGLEPLTGLEYIGINGMPAITEEIRERFENGEPMEEILKPYLDAMFGEAG